MVDEEDSRPEDNEKGEVISRDSEELQKALEETLRKNEEFLGMLQRLQADFENYKKRVARESDELRTSAEADLILDLLPFLDDMERALAHEKNEALAMVYTHMKKDFEKKGLEDVENTNFDPYLHEAIAVVESDEYLEDAIVEVLKKGYKYRGKVIRPSQVVVNKKRGKS